MTTHRVSLLAVAGALAAALSAPGPAVAAEPNLPMPSPEALYRSAVRTVEPKREGTGEQFCWNAAWSMRLFVQAYEAWGESSWLDWGVKYYDYCVGKMATGPDGYKGWIGPMGRAAWADVHVGDAILLDRMLEFSELVLKDPALKAKYAEPANRYVQVARKHLIEKWDRRGTWREDGPYGAYVSFNRYCEPGKLDQWKALPEGQTEKQGLTLPFNKQNDVAQCCLKLYRITGEKLYLDKAQKIFAYMRSRFQYVADKDYYVWNYWEPFGPWDVDLAKKTTRHWMNVHGYRNYQAGEIGQIAEAYHTGIVFTPLDIERIVNTNLKVMWNQDKADPKYVNSNALLPQPVLTPEQRKAQEEAERNNPYAKEGRAGTLWTALDDFSQPVRDLEAVRMARPSRNSHAQIGRAYYYKVTLKTPASPARRYAPDAKVEQAPVSSCLSLTVATVMPQAIGDKPSVVLCKSRIDNDLEVAVWSADGKDKKFVLHKGKIEGGTDGLVGIFILQWDGADPATKARLPKGNYRMRWTVPDGYREFPVVIP